MTRVTSNNLNDFSVRQLASQTSRLQDLQRQLSTGLKAERPSDDPTSIRKALVEADRVSRFEQHEETLNQSTARLGEAHTQLRSAQQLIVQAKVIALQGRQSTSESEIDVLSSELDSILEQLVNVANSEDHNGYLFAGTKTADRPFTQAVSTDQRFDYAGTNDALQLFITGRESSAALQPGLDVFGGAIRGEVEVIGDNGIAAGSGGSSAVGFRHLTVQHTSTAYQAFSGLQAGVSSPGGDNIVGDGGTHFVTLNDTSGTGAFGTVSINNGIPVDFTSADTDLKVTGPNGEIIYVDTTSITPGVSGRVDLIANGTLSIDGGATQVPIEFEDNQAVTDPRDGSVIFLNTSGASSTKSIDLEFSGTFDAFQTVVALKEDLVNSRGLNAGQRDEALGRRIADVDRIGDHLLSEIGVQSVNLERFDQLSSVNDEQKLAHQITLSEITSVDFAAAAIQLQETLNLQQYTMATVGLVTSPNLLDFIR